MRHHIPLSMHFKFDNIYFLVCTFALVLCNPSSAQLGFEPKVILDDSSHLDVIGFCLEDFNGDTYPDLMTISQASGTINFISNINGTGTYAYPLEVSDKVEGAHTMACGDFDNDSDMDIIVSSETERHVAFFRNNGDGTLSDSTIIATDILWPIFNNADLDNDGDLDVVMSQISQFSWIENVDGLGSFAPEVKIDLGLEYHYLLINDINDDGFQDAITFGYEKITAISGENGQWDTAIELGDNDGNIKNATVGDLNGDNRKDIAFTNQVGKKLYVMYGNGGFDFDQPVIEYNSQNMEQISINDMDGDGINDIVLGGNEHMFWLKNDNLGNFTRNNLFLEHEDLNILKVADINNDEKLDVVAGYIYTENFISATIQNENGFNREIDIYNIVERTGKMTCQDVNGDGRTDIILRMQDPFRMAILYKNALNEYDLPLLIHFPVSSSNVTEYEFVDVDNDGDLDIIFIGVLPTSSVGWIENHSNQSFGPPQVLDFNFERIAPLAYIDYDEDGFTDIVVSDLSKLVAIRNNQGVFDQRIVLDSFEVNFWQMHLADVDGDEDLDIIHTNYDGEIFWRENVDDSFTYGPQNFIHYEERNFIHSVQDYDQDGDADLIYGGRLNKGLYSLRNNESFSANIQPIKMEESGNRFTHLVDLDGDEDLDLLFNIVNSSFQDDLGWYENLENGEFGPAQIIDESIGSGAKAAPCKQLNANFPDIVIQSNQSLIYYTNKGNQRNDIYGKVLLDINRDSCQTTDVAISDQYVELEYNGDLTGQLSTGDGNYQFIIDTGWVSIKLDNVPENYIALPDVTNHHFITNDSVLNQDFCLLPTDSICDVSISIYPLDEPRPGFMHQILVVYENQGTQSKSGTVTLELGIDKLDSIGVSNDYVQISDSVIQVEYINLHPFESRQFIIPMKIKPPPHVNLGDWLTVNAEILPLEDDATIENNTLNFIELLIGSYDPNDITVLEGDSITLEDAKGYLHYLIRFQNTGTASAINVNVENVLDELLDWSTFKLEALSHEGKVEIVNRSELNFIFNNINLPDSISNEEESHGFIAYKIKPKSTATLGDVIQNFADIYFDFNLPITTNTVTTRIYEQELSTQSPVDSPIIIAPNPVSNRLKIVHNKIFESYKIYNFDGQLMQSGKVSPTLDVSNFTSGPYLILLQDKSDHRSVHKFIIHK